MDLVIATQNKHKIQEISQILSDINIIIPEQKLNITEGSRSYIENSILKAKSWAKLYPDHYILSDDSGLEIEALNNAPGVISSDWAGENSTQEALLDKLDKEMANIPWEKRQARFVSYMVLLSPNGESMISRGECQGYIALKLSGKQGFGYDPMFIPLGYDTTMAELSSEEKNALSHRYKALIGIKDYLQYKELI